MLICFKLRFCKRCLPSKQYFYAPNTITMNRLLSLCLCLLYFSAFAQRPVVSSSDIYQEIKKLNVCANVLYVAAHPDDENTRLIAWLENEKLVRTAYLSLTRGDGGQNLIGTEKGDAMGVLRTQELIEARKIDGAEQFFSSAVDFGYSKTAAETLEKWNKYHVLGDVVYRIREFQPDIIITRFPPDKRAGHGHHTASAMLAEIAFELAADAKQYPEHLKLVKPWQSKRILWNTSVWWDKSIPEQAELSDDFIVIDYGEYNPILGLSYSEIAAESRSQHRSQGFGSAKTRGSQLEYLKHTAGSKAKKDLFHDIDMSWKRVKGGAVIGEKVDAIIAAFDFKTPHQSVKALAELYTAIDQMEDNPYKEEKLNSLKRIIEAAAGIHVEMISRDYDYPAFQLTPVDLTAEFIVRSPVNVIMEELKRPDTTISNITLNTNELKQVSFTTEIAIHPSHPYWLREELFEHAQKNNMSLIHQTGEYGLPMNRPKLIVRYSLNIEGQSIPFERKVQYRWTDRVYGGLYRDLWVSPEVTATASQGVYLFANEQAKKVELMIMAHKDSIKNSIKAIVPEGWQVEPQEIPFELILKGEELKVSFNITPPKGESTAELKFQFSRSKARGQQVVDYEHIEPQVIYPETKLKLVKTSLKTKVQKVAYIKGSGDDVPQGLRSIGLTVDEFEATDLPKLKLSDYNCILLGIRAYNTQGSLRNGNKLLTAYVEQGGTLIIQYNTSRGLKSDELGPLDLKLSRGRVTEEDAKVTLLEPDHPVLQAPNKIRMEDFDHWVQERGLYFADSWDEAYTPLIAWNDKGEEPLKGSLLVGDYGTGKVVFTGISFFRQLPAGVPGAYRLLVNLINYGQN